MEESAAERVRPAVSGDARPGALAGLALVALVVALALWESLAALLAPGRVATAADWEAAAAEVRAGFQPGDLIVFAPAWSDAVGRLHLGDLIPPEMAARADESGYRRVWEVSIRGARAPETLADATYPASTTRHGKVKVTLYTRSNAVTPLYDFTAHLGDARVTQVALSAAGAPGSERPCLADWVGGAGGLAAFRCASTRVERRVLEVDFAPHRGVLAPADPALVTRIEFRDVPLGNSIVGYTGMHDWHARKYGAGPVDFKIFVDGVQLLAERHGSLDGWHRHTVPTLRYSGARATVVFEIAAPAGARERTLGFHVESRSEAPAAGATGGATGGGAQ